MTVAPPTTLPPRRSRLRTLLLVAVVFVSGIVVGAGGATVVVARRVQQAIRHPESLPDRIVDRLRGRLDLRPDQADRVRAILVARQAALSRIRADVQPQVMRELAGVRDEVGEALDPRQRARWDTLYDDLVDRWLPPSVPMPTTRAALDF